MTNTRGRGVGRSSRSNLVQEQTGTLLRDVLGIPRAGKRVRAKKRKPMDGGERLRIVDTLIAVIEGAYCHLPQKRAAYATNPVQALRLLRIRAAGISDSEFHLAITSIMAGLRDAHTLYSGPIERGVATLPFLIEQFGPHDNPKFIVSKVSSLKPVVDKHFVKGVELTSWNGIPMARAVDLFADYETGGRQDARRARALESLTFRSLEYLPPPDEVWVVIQYRAKGRRTREIRLPWRVVHPERSPTGSLPGSRASRHMGVNPAAEQVRRAKKLMFSGKLWQAENGRQPVAREKGWIKTTMQDALAARVINTKALGPIGYLRIWTFDVDDDDAFVDEIARLLELLPDHGLIVDLRGNPGGLIWAAERALQLLTPNLIIPTRFSVLATPLMRAMAESPFNRQELGAWLPSLQKAISTGEVYSQPLPLTDPLACNDIGQRYSGPVVCVVDPNTYSSGDLFAAGFLDNRIGPLVCVGEATGAGGANVWSHYDLAEALADTPFALGEMPGGVGFTLAIRRAVRAGAADGMPIEDLGVPGIPYAMTQRDLLDENKDLIKCCAGLLVDTATTVMRAEVNKNTVTVTTRGLDELETYVDGRPLEPVRKIDDGAKQFPSPRGTMIEFVGRCNGLICQRRRLFLSRQ